MKSPLRPLVIAVIFAGVILLVATTAPGHAKDTDYDPATGEPKCFDCHTPERRYSIDYTMDKTCAQCHGPEFSDRYLDINGRYRAGAEGDKPVYLEFRGEGAVKDAPLGIGTYSMAKNDRGADAMKAPVAKKKRARKTLAEQKAEVLIPAGEFTMGSNDWWPKSMPEHKRSLPAFSMDKYEVTNARYKEFVEATGRMAPDHWLNGNTPKDREEHPVVFVTWADADAFCKWDGKRLPTEAEWEKAARGADKRTFPWGDKFSKYYGNIPPLGIEDTMPVGSFEEGRSPYGLYDMAGNVWEWTSDWFKPYPGNAHADENYGEKFKVLRGGSWYDCTKYKCGISFVTYNKIFFNAQTKNNNFGFRCAKNR